MLHDIYLQGIMWYLWRISKCSSSQSVDHGKISSTSVTSVTSFTALQEMATRKENALLADKTKIEMAQKIEEVAAKISALEQNCAVLDDGIRQKTAKEESLLSGIMQVYLIALGLDKVTSWTFVSSLLRSTLTCVVPGLSEHLLQNNVTGPWFWFTCLI